LLHFAAVGALNFGLGNLLILGLLFYIGILATTSLEINIVRPSVSKSRNTLHEEHFDMAYIP